MFSDTFTAGITDTPLFYSYQRGSRTIYCPNDAMREVHARFLAYLRENATGRPWNTLPSAVGGVPYDGRRTYHIRRHTRGKDGKEIARGVCQISPPPTFPRYLFKLDIANAYGSVEIDTMSHLVYEVDKRLGGLSPLEDIRHFLEKFCFVPRGNGLITGAPSSLDLFNLYGEKYLDCFIREWGVPRGIVYTRYVDDLLFSSEQPFGKKRRKVMRGFIERAGFRVNDRKVRLVDLEKGPAVICGIGVRADGSCFLPRRKFRRLRGMFHLLQQGKLDAAQKQLFGGLWGEQVGAFYPTDCALEQDKKMFKRWNEHKWLSFM